VFFFEEWDCDCELRCYRSWRYDGAMPHPQVSPTLDSADLGVNEKAIKSPNFSRTLVKNKSTKYAKAFPDLNGHFAAASGDWAVVYGYADMPAYQMAKGLCEVYQRGPQEFTV